MKIFSRDDIMTALDEQGAIEAIERAIIAYAAGEAQSGDAGHFSFPDAPGDAHVKVAHLAGEEIFALKVSSSFYSNPDRGLSSSQGFSAVVSATTGQALALFDDGGWLTDIRTAMAGAIAARAIGASGGTLGIVGTGIQARLQADFVRRRIGAERLLIWGRDSGKARALAEELGGEARDLADLVRSSDLVVTTTPSTEPMILDDWVPAGARIVAVGSDGGGKRELDPKILGRATVVVDSPAKCLENGEAGWAVRQGLIAAETLIPLGELLAHPRTFDRDAVVVVDLTGLPVQDAAIAGSAWRALSAGAA